MKKTLWALLLVGVVFGCNENTKTKTSQPNEADKPTVTLSSDELAAFADQGLEYAMSAQAVLGKNLVQAIQNDGVLGALAFCNERAYPLTDSMSVVHKVQLKRVSDKPRNQHNNANLQELDHIETFKQQILNNTTSVKPITTETETGVLVYYPVLTNAMCLQCHGQPQTDIASTTLKKLDSLYPQDQAIGYSINEVRGLWRVAFEK